MSTPLRLLDDEIKSTENKQFGGIFVFKDYGRALALLV